MKHCTDCKDGEHDNIDDDIRLMVVRNPDTHKIHKKGYLCADHREMYAEDGYMLYQQKA